MAERPVFLPKNSWPFYTTEEVSFKWYAGFALIQKRRNIEGIHEAYLTLHPQARLLEASSKSANPFGESLSPFYLEGELDGRKYPVECIFQASKVFQKGGPFPQLLDMPAVKAKTTSLTKSAGPLLYYEYAGERWPLDPRGWLFNYIYLKALQGHPEKLAEIEGYTGFTDVAMSPKGSTCQAEALAMALGLRHKGLFDEALASIPDFLRIVCHVKEG